MQSCEKHVAGGWGYKDPNSKYHDLNAEMQWTKTFEIHEENEKLDKAFGSSIFYKSRS